MPEELAGGDVIGGGGEIPRRRQNAVSFHTGTQVAPFYYEVERLREFRVWPPHTSMGNEVFHFILFFLALLSGV